jgi:hypothetical protein
MASLPELTWVHISDFHMGKDLAEQKRVCTLAVDVLEEVERRRHFDLLFITGDLTYKGSPQGYEDLKAHFLSKLEREVADDIIERTYVVPGNHDLNRKVNTEEDAYSALSRNERTLDPNAEGRALRKPFIDRFSDFCEHDPTNRAAWLSSEQGTLTDSLRVRGRALGILGLNTAWFAQSDGDEQKLTPGHLLVWEGVQKLAECEFIVCLGHHPLDWISRGERDEITMSFNRKDGRGLVYPFGHHHVASSEWLGVHQGRCHLGLQAGCLYADRKHVHRPSIAVGALVRNQDGRQFVEVRPWTYVKAQWREDSTAYDRDYWSSTKRCFEFGTTLEGRSSTPTQDQLSSRHEARRSSAPPPERCTLSGARPQRGSTAPDGRQRALWKHRNDLLKYFEDRALTGYLRSLQSMTQASQGAIDPVAPLPDGSMLSLCTVLKSPKRVIAILPHPESTPDMEGVGRSGIAHLMAGFSIAYPPFLQEGQPELSAQLSPSSVRRDLASEWRIISTDLAYLGSVDGRLAATPTTSEPLSFAWDLARHVFRMTDLEYLSGAHRTPAGRERQFSLFRSVDLESVGPQVGWTDPVLINEVWILRRATPLDDGCGVEQLRGARAKRCLLAALTSPVHHSSPFWTCTAAAGVTQGATALVNSLDGRKKMPVRLMTLGSSSARIPLDVLSEAAQRISSKDVGERRSEWSLPVGVGVGYHNRYFLGAIHSESSVGVQATSGEKVLHDPAFWSAVLARKTPQEIVVNLLDPDSPDALRWQEKAYKDYTQVGRGRFLIDEIGANIAAIKRMIEYLRQTGGPVHLTLKLHKKRPTFRITMIGLSMMIVTAYQEQKRTGSSTRFCAITSDSDPDLFAGLKSEYDQIDSQSRILDHT